VLRRKIEKKEEEKSKKEEAKLKRKEKRKTRNDDYEDFVDDLEDVQYVEEEKGFFGKILQSPVLLTVGAILVGAIFLNMAGGKSESSSKQFSSKSIADVLDEDEATKKPLEKGSEKKKPKKK